MKYFTREWYELCQKMSFHLLLEEESQAETFSEEYFIKLYQEKLNNWVELQKEVALYIKKRMTLEDSNIKLKEFDQEKASEEFYKQLTCNVDNIKKSLPDEILNEIADVRVFVLHKASRKVISIVTEFCKANKESVNRTINEYNDYFKTVLLPLDNVTLEQIRFHDCIIYDIDLTENTLTLLLDNSGGFTNINKVVFYNYKIIKQDNFLLNATWLYEETYKLNDKYELHVLLHSNELGLIEFTISFENVTLH